MRRGKFWSLYLNTFLQGNTKIQNLLIAFFIYKINLLLDVNLRLKKMFDSDLSDINIKKDEVNWSPKKEKLIKL